MQYKKKFINDRILESGRTEYLEKGFRVGNISTIATNAGVPVGNLYRYFDGKSGLLDAIVKPAYTELPKMIGKLSDMFDPALGATETFITELTKQLMQIFDEFGREIVILADKCATTRYEDFAEIIINQVSVLVEGRLYPEGTPEDKFMADLISKAFINSLFDILRMNDPAITEQAILRVLKFFFFEAEKRK